MRNLIRAVVNGTLQKYGYEVRRRHESKGFLRQVKFATVIDGGANVGDYAAKMRGDYPCAEIHAFEPTPKLFQGLKQRFAGDAKISCYDLALGDEDGSATFHVTHDTVSSSLLEEAEAGSYGLNEAVTVSVKRLDTWASNLTISRPALLKLDIEGNELAAMRGAEKVLSQIDYIELETTFVSARIGQPTFREILNFLNDHDFELIDVYPGILDSKTGRANWADALFARRAPTMNDKQT